MDFDELSPLDEIDLLLREMYGLAQRAAQDECEDDERLVLQEQLEALMELLDNAADRYDEECRDLE